MTAIRRTRIVRRRRGRGGLASIFPAGSLAVLGRRMMSRSVGMGRRKRTTRTRRRRTGKGLFGKALGIGSSLADALGFGRRRRRRPVRRVRRVRSGRGIFSTLKSLGTRALGFAKKHSLISRGLSSLGYNRASSIAKIAGFGRARRRPTSRRTVKF